MTRSSVAAKNTASNDDATNLETMAYSDWLERKEEVEDRLKLISVPAPASLKSKAKTVGTNNKRSRRRGVGSRGGGKSHEHPEPVNSNTVASTTEPTTQGSTSAIPPIPYAPKIDVHWDFVMKELMWLGTDFQSERKRQIASARKLGASIIKFHENKEKRRLRQLQMAETKRKKLAAKVGRDVKGWWTKLEKIVAYKQKLSADRERQASMNKQLVKLVQQTEKYTESLSLHKKDASLHHRVSTEEDDSTDEHDEGSTDDEDKRHSGRRKRRRKSRKSHPRKPSEMTIEEALAKGAARRKTKSRSIDYSRMKLEESEFYGESTADEGSVGSIGSDPGGAALDDEEYSPPPSDGENTSELSDDETTLRAAMDEEMKTRQRKKSHRRGQTQTGDAYDSEDIEYSADPEELRKLHEEQGMAIEEVLDRLQAEGDERQHHDMDSDDIDAKDATKQRTATKHVHFKEEDSTETAAVASMSQTGSHPKCERLDPGEDADDDGDASDVEDYHDTADGFGITTMNGTQNADDNDDLEDFQACEPEPDDETTLEAEERLGRDMTYEEEIELLNRENELSIEELRKIYAGLNAEVDKEMASDAATAGAKTELIESDKKEDSASSDDGDDEFIADKNEVDDETTMEAEERLGRDMTYSEEIEMLNRENSMSVDELRAMYAGLYSNGIGKENLDQQQVEEQISAETSGTDDDSRNNEDDDDNEFEADENEFDDETTMEAEEKLGRDMTYEEELELLNRENEMSVEELRAMYAGVYDNEERSDRPQTEEETIADNSNTDDDSRNSDDDEFEADKNEVDDETTMEAEEKLGREMTYEEELEMLNRENEMSIEELRAMYAGIDDDVKHASSNASVAIDNDNNDDSQTGKSNEGAPTSELLNNDTHSTSSDDIVSASDDDGEFQVTGAPELDDETTMEAEEKLGRDMTYEEELELLNRENEMPIEQLKAMYADMNGTNNGEIGSKDESETEESVEMKVNVDSSSKDNTADTDEVQKKRKRDQSVSDGSVSESDRAAKRTREGRTSDSENDGTAAMKALEASAVKARETLASRPFLLAPWVKLRKYQQVGLNWLVSLQSRRLNGILADEMG